MNCEAIGQFRIDRETLRFLRTYFAGYTAYDSAGREDTGNTPLIGMGTCSPL